jgi:hypothetical protein
MIVKLESSLEKSYKTNLHIQNNHFEIIYDSTIQFESGNQINEIFISIDSEKFSGINKMTVVPLNDEEKVDNNHYEFRVNNISSNDVILLISGSLSPNTSIIKSILRKIDKAEVKHSFRIDAMHWNELPSDLLNTTPRMIVLDDFPLVKNDQLMMNQIISDAKKIQSQIVYLEGPNSNLSTAEMIRLHFPTLIPLAIDSNNPTELSEKSMSLGAFGVDISDFPPQYRSVKWTTINKSWISYTDNSFMLATMDNLFMLSVPDIMACHLKTNQNNSSAMRKLIRNMFLHAFYRNDGFLDLHINKNSFNIGDNINASIQTVEQLELKNLLLSVIHVGSDTVKIDCSKEILSNDYKCNHILQKAGEYIFIAEAMLPNEEQVVSNSIEVVVQNINIEHKDLTQEKYILTLIAHKTKGHYLPIESLDSMLTLIDITPVQLIKNYQLSGLSTQYYWWFLILLLGVEWYYRKKLGFL